MDEAVTKINEILAEFEEEERLEILLTLSYCNLCGDNKGYGGECYCWDRLDY